MSYGFSGRSSCRRRITKICGDWPCHGPHYGTQIFVSVSGSLHPCLTVIFCCLFVRENPRRGASGFCGRGEWTGDECNTEKPSAGGPELPDGSHPLSQAICSVCGRRGNQHSHLESHGFPINCPGDSVSRPSRPDRRTILPAREGWQPQLPCLIVPCFRGCNALF